jgi:phosphoglycolate phosphatase-like HAD superfamily hydrolase
LRPGLGSGLVERLHRHPLYRDFLELMPLGNRAEDFAVALSILERGVEVADQADYDREWQAQDGSFLTAFHSSFYERRAEFAESDPTGWRRLLHPYPAFIDLLRARRGEVVFAIATAKDGPSVRALLDLYGIEALFEPGCVLDKDTGVSKCVHLELLAAHTGTPFSEITFVDDKVSHLDSVASLGVRCALAAWGYNGARERALARERSYLVCELSDAERLLFG